MVYSRQIRQKRRWPISATDLIRKGSGLFFCCLVISWAVRPTDAADWNARSTLSQRFEADNNITVSADNAGYVLASISRLSTTIEAVAPTYRFDLGQTFDLRQYAGPGRSDIDDVFEYLNLSAGLTKETKSTSYLLGAALIIDPTSSTEFLEETGQTAERNVNRITLRANGSVTHQVNARNSIAYDISAAILEFSGDTGAFTPYVRADTGLTWTHAISGRTSVSGRGSLGYSQFDNEANTTNLTFSATAGVEHRLTKRLSASLDIGVLGAQIREDATLLLPADNEFGIGPTANFSIDYRRKRTAISLTGTQSLEPSGGDGELVSRTSVAFRLGHEINGDSSLSLDVTASRFESASSTGGTDTQVLTMAPTYTRRINRNWDAKLGYLFRYRDNGVDAASSNKVFFSLSRDISWLP